MDSLQEEQYVFHRFAHGDVNKALMCLDRIEGQNDGFVSWCLLQTAVIAYCRLFAECKISKGRSLRLASRFVPREGKTLHGRLISWRNKIIAHSDLELREPKLHGWTGQNGTTFGVVFRGFYSDELMGELVCIKDLFRSVLTGLAHDLDEREQVFSKAAEAKIPVAEL
jgi:hypothetical protein